MTRDAETGGQPYLALRGLSKSFGALGVLDDVSFEVARGEALVICGPSGCGKSTLLRCLNGLEPVDRGRLTLDGHEIDLADARQRGSAREGTGLVFQNFNLFPHMRVLENLALAPRRVRGLTRRQAQAEAGELLERVGLAEKAGAYPCELSGGQRQRVAIARALAMRPKLLMFDEPTSALDPEKKEEVLGVIRALREEDAVTMIVVTHEIGFGRNVADRAILLEDGRIVEQGPAKTFFEAPREERTQRFLKAIVNA